MLFSGMRLRCHRGMELHVLPENKNGLRVAVLGSGVGGWEF